MKKVIPHGMVALSALFLSACTQKNSAAAKETFISDLVQMNSTKNNRQETQLLVDRFSVSGDKHSSLQTLKGTSLDLTVKRDSAQHTLNLSGSATFDQIPYPIDLTLSQKGIYVSSADLKQIYNHIKPTLAQEFGPYAGLYGGMFNHLKAPYLFVGQSVLDSGRSQKSNEKWAETFKSLLEPAVASKDQLKKAYQHLSNDSFTQKGDEATLSVTEKNISFSELIKKIPSFSTQVNEDQLKDLIKSSKDTTIKTVTIVSTINGKTNQLKTKISGDVIDTKSKEGEINFAVTTRSKTSSSNQAITEPDSSNVISLEQLQQDTFSDVTKDTNT